METPQQDRSPFTQNAPDIRRARTLTLICAGLLATAFTILVIVLDQDFPTSAFIGAFGLLFLLPHLVILFNFQTREPQAGLKAAAQTGGAISILTGLILAPLLLFGVGSLASVPAHEALQFLGVLAVWSALFGLHAALYREARRLLRQHVPKGSAGWRLHAGVIGTSVVLGGLLLLFMTFTPSLLRSRAAANETSAVGTLRTLHTGAQQYRDAYGNGYPATLALMALSDVGGPTCAAPDLIHPLWGTGVKNGYRFNYQAGAVIQKPVAGCPPGVVTFAVSARPLEFGKSGRRSLFLDASGEIRWTVEERAATASDPPLN